MVKTVHFYVNVVLFAVFTLCLLLVAVNNYYVYTPDVSIYGGVDNTYSKTYFELLRISAGNLTEADWILSDVTPDICDENSTFIISIVLSAVRNFDQRMLVRKSWASEGLVKFNAIKVLFIVGATLDSNIQRKIDREAKEYKDLIQTSFIDAYRNLTYKTVSALKWVSENCDQVPWVAKIDDDVIVNPFNLKTFLDSQYKVNHNASMPLIFGRVRKNAKPMHEGKWIVTKNEYPYKIYPPFVLGSAYIIGQSAVNGLLAQAKNTPFLWLEDVFLTGLVAEGAKIGRKSIEHSCFVNRLSTKLLRGKAVFFVGAKPKLFKYAWTKILKYSNFMKGKKIL